MKTKIFLFVLILAAVFGCDNAVLDGKNTRPEHVVSQEPFDLKFSGNASDSVMKAVTSAWYIYSFDLPYFSPFEVHPSDIMLKENTAKSETFSYEWITVSKTDS
ncbi:MAG: hypothetical protein LBJ23_01880, partial [Tannerella sp.]|nr:hypothetical protein [Tannerella sp.]